MCTRVHMYRYELRGLPVRPPATGAPVCMYIGCIGAGGGRDDSRGASGRARECSGECACEFTDHFRPALRQPTLRRAVVSDSS